MADENPLRRVPWVTVLLVLACVWVFFTVQPIGRVGVDQVGFERIQRQELVFSLDNAAIPCEVVQGRPLTVGEVEATFVGGDPSACGIDQGMSPPASPGKRVWLALLVSMFLHGGVSHLVANMLFLWVFGNNIEDRRGPVVYLAFYLTAGVVATLAHIVSDPASTVPIVGASGAVAGVMGAYLVWFPDARIKTLVVVGPVLLRKVKAKFLLGLWFASQFLLVSAESGVAWAAHVGGFTFGVLMGLVWRGRDRRVSAGLPAPV